MHHGVVIAVRRRPMPVPETWSPIYMDDDDLLIQSHRFHRNAVAQSLNTESRLRWCVQGGLLRPRSTHGPFPEYDPGRGSRILQSK